MSHLWSFLRACFIAFVGCAAAVPAWAQQGQLAPDQVAQMEKMASLAELGGLLFSLIVFAAILLIARRNMKGWDQPLSWVWFSFSGRLNRKAYWLKGVVLMSMVGLGVQLFAALLGFLIGSSALGGMLGVSAALIVLLPLLVFNFWVSMAISVKRAHDLGHSGWWLLLFLAPIYNLWMAIVMGFFRGSPGPNDFGPDPIDPIDDYVNEMFGADGENGAENAPGPAHPQPRPPQGGDDAPKGFGARAFAKSTAPAAPTPEPVVAPVEMSGGSANLDVIKRRLGDDILRPIKRKGGSGRDPLG